MFRSIGRRSLSSNSMLRQQTIELLRYELSPIITTQDLYAIASHILTPSSICHEVLYHFCLRLHEVDNDESRIIINKCHEISCTTIGSYTHRAADIRMDQVTGL